MKKNRSLITLSISLCGVDIDDVEIETEMQRIVYPTPTHPRFLDFLVCRASVMMEMERGLFSPLARGT